MIRLIRAIAAGTLLLAPPCDAATFVVTNTLASGAGSLSQAITSANATAATDTINFNILLVRSVHVIDANLPAITQPVVIDGYTQSGASENTKEVSGSDAVLKIALDGTDLPTGEPVLEINASSTSIRGLIIQGIQGKGSGIKVGAGATNVTIRGCFVGVKTGGTVDSSSGTGILVDGTATIGTASVVTRNLISGNTIGIHLKGPGSLVRNNILGTDKNIGELIPNGDGIVLATPAASDCRIGGSTKEERNFILGSTQKGIRLDATAGNGNAIQGNIMLQNAKLGIDLGNDGVTLNDEDDTDDGPNRLQNFPELAFARTNGADISVRGSLSGQPGTYEIEVFGVIEPHPSGYGEAIQLLGKTQVAIGIDQTTTPFSAVYSLENDATVNLYLTATARNVATNDTSEFSRGVYSLLAGDELTVTNINDSGAGSLRAAILAANAAPGANTIVFAIPGAGPHTIQPLTEYSISESVIIDGYSQGLSSPNTLLHGSNADLRIAIDGSLLPPATGGILSILGADSFIRGLAIHSGPQHGLRSANSDRVHIEGCFIGTDAGGQMDRGNGMSGIFTGTSRDMVIGGPARGQRNVISGNGDYGILDNGERTIILNNIIGATASGNAALGNGDGGMVTASEDGRIGSDEPDRGNVIRTNGGAGITISSGASGQTVLGNSIDANATLGIDIAPAPGPATVTANDIDDVDTGPNDRQNFPVIDNAVFQDGQLTVEGSLDVPVGDVNKVYTIRVFASESCDSLGHGEGAEFLGAEPVLLSDAADGFSFSLAAELDGSEQITATATETLLGNTSEFSACFDLSGSQPACGDASGDGDVTAGDALTALRTGVGSASCAACICDVNGQGGVTASDALVILRVAVGQSVTLSCPACT
jgi:trimeric autotransporter adhesin